MLRLITKMFTTSPSAIYTNDSLLREYGRGEDFKTDRLRCTARRRAMAVTIARRTDGRLTARTGFRRATPLSENIVVRDRDEYGIHDVRSPGRCLPLGPRASAAALVGAATAVNLGRLHRLLAFGEEFNDLGCRRLQRSPPPFGNGQSVAGAAAAAADADETDMM
jgi:hypothetical protein